MNERQRIAENLKQIRKSRNITVKQVANDMGISPSTLYSYENAYRRITLPRAVKLASYFGVSLEQIVS